MKCGRILLEMLKKYDVSHVFGLPGETTLALYDEWKRFDGIEHVMVRDERNSVFMADGYAKVSGRPGVCEGPSVGAPHMLPGIVEAYSSCVPIIAITSDIPLAGEKHNMLTGADQTSMFKAFVKETLTVHSAAELPFIVRRAFRLATSGRPGPVHIRLPQDVLAEDAPAPDLYAQPEFCRTPGRRFAAAERDIKSAIEILQAAKRGVIFCGQGALTSQAWDEVQAVADRFELAVVTTINGKGIIAETHRLSGGVAGARGANSFSNGLVRDADAIFFVGSSTDSAGTWGWRIPQVDSDVPIVQLDASEAELGNNYKAQVMLLGDAKETLARMLDLSEGAGKAAGGYTDEIAHLRAEYENSLADALTCRAVPCNPVRVMRELEAAMPENSKIVTDPGIAAVYTAGFIRMKRPGRNFVCNFAQGALGYATGAAIGAAKAAPESTIVHITGDGSFGFCTGEYETLARTGCNVKVILVNNGSFGWIRVSDSMSGNGGEPFATQFSGVDYVALMKGYGIPAERVTTQNELACALKRLFETRGPAMLEIPFEPEDKCVPPVPGWAEKARAKGMKNYY